MATYNRVETLTGLIIKACLYLLVLLTPFIVGSPFTVAPLFKINSRFIRDSIALDQFRLVKEVFVQIMILILVAAYVVRLSLSTASRAEHVRALRLARSYVFIPVVLFALLSVISILLSPDKDLAWLSVRNVLLYTALYFIVIQVGHKNLIKNLLYLVLIAGVINAIYVVLQYFGHDPFFLQYDRTKVIGRYSAGGSLDNPNVAGIYFALAFICTMSLLLAATSLRKKLILLTGLLVLLVGLIYTQTLTAIAGLIAGMIVWVGMLFYYERAARKHLILGLVLLLAAAGIVTGINEGFRDRLKRTIQSVQTRDWNNALSSRNIWWRVSIDMIKAKPLLGHGIGSFKPLYFDYQRDFSRQTGIKISLPLPGQLHNEYLQLWVELGIIGPLIFLYAIIAHIKLGLTFVFRPVLKKAGDEIKKSKKERKTEELMIRDLKERKRLAMGLVAAVVTISINAIANFTFHLAAIASLAAVLAGSLVRLSIEQEEEGQKRVSAQSQNKLLRILVALSAIVLAFLTIRHSFNFYQASVEANVAYNMLLPVQAGQIENDRNKKILLLVAEQRLEKAKKLDPYESDIYMLLGGAYRLQNKYEKALKEYEKAVYYAPSCETYSALGSAYFNLHEIDKAKESYSRALEFNPYFEPARKGIELSNKMLAPNSR